MRNDSRTEKKRKHGFCQCRCNRHPWSHGCLRTYENTVYTLDSDGQFLRLFPQAEDIFVVPEVYTDIQDDSIIVYKYLEEYEI